MISNAAMAYLFEHPNGPFPELFKTELADLFIRSDDDPIEEAIKAVSQQASANQGDENPPNKQQNDA